MTDLIEPIPDEEQPKQSNDVRVEAGVAAATARAGDEPKDEEPEANDD